MTSVCVSEHIYAHTHASTQTDRISQRVEISRHLCLVQLEHIEVYTSDPDIQDLQGENYFPLFLPYMSYTATATYIRIVIKPSLMFPR